MARKIRHKSQKQLDYRDRNILHRIRVAAEVAMERQAHGHTDGWQRLREWLDKADDEIGVSEDFQP
jgi:hypothetical protein